jgi:predicted Zn-dependent protease
MLASVSHGERMRVFALLAALSAGSFALAAQQLAPAPARPRLSAQADTNDAAAYYLYGTIWIGKNAAMAQASFYWATRLDPEMADAYYARAIAYTLAFRDSVTERHLRGGNSENDPTQQQVAFYDSLMYNAFAREPFLDPRFNLLLYPPEIRKLFPKSSDPDLRGDYAFTTHEYAQALAEWARALKQDPHRYGLRVKRARAFYYAQELDSAYNELALVVDTLEARQQAKLGKTRVYLSKEMYLYQMGVIRERQGDRAAARELYGRALSESIGWFMAHVRLARLAALAGDSAVAVSEWDLAVQIRDYDPSLHYRYADLLLGMGRTEDAAKQLHRAIAVNQDYAPPYALLGRAEEARGHRKEALEAYTEFTRRAARADPLAAGVQQRITALSSGSGGGAQ